MSKEVRHHYNLLEILQFGSVKTPESQNVIFFKPKIEAVES